MTRKNRMKEFVPGRGYTKEDWDDADSPELTDEQIAKGKPFAKRFPIWPRASSAAEGAHLSPSRCSRFPSGLNRR